MKRFELFSQARGLNERRVIESPLGDISLVLISWEQEATLAGTSQSQKEQTRQGARTMSLEQAKGRLMLEGPS